MSEWDVYWWLKLDSIVFIPVIILVALLIVTFMITDEDNCHLTLPLYALAFSLLMGLAILIPSTRQYAMIKVFPKIANSEVVKEIPDDMADMYSMAKEYMKDMMKGAK